MLTPEARTLITIISAAHQTVDALARVAANDMEAVEAAIRVERIFSPTRSLPDDYDVPRPYAPASPGRCQALHDAYRSALDGSLQAALVLDQLSTAAEAPSRTLGLARAAASIQSHRRASESPAADASHRDLAPADLKALQHSRASTGRPGPVEQIIRGRQVSDPVTLLRAAAIDNAAQHLITEAGNAARTYRPSGSTESARRTSNAAGLAAQSFPHKPITQPPDSNVDVQPNSSRHDQPSRKTRLRGSKLPAVYGA